MHLRFAGMVPEPRVRVNNFLLNLIFSQYCVVVMSIKMDAVRSQFFRFERVKRSAAGSAGSVAAKA